MKAAPQTTTLVEVGAMASHILASVWRWWWAEISATVPAPIRRIVERDRDKTLLLAGEDSVVLCSPKDGEGIQLPCDPGLLEAARTQLRNHATKPGPLWLCPSAASVLRTTLALPAAVEENLAEVLCFELDRRTPFSAVDAYFAYRIVSRDRGRGYIQVELAVTPRRLVANALLVAVRLGLAVGAIDLSSEAGAGELLTGVEGDGRSATDSRRIRAMRWCVAVSVLSVAIVAGAVPILRSFDQIADLGHQIVNARAAAENAADLEDEIARLSGDTAFLVGRKRDDTTAIRILAELTARLPDGTWLEDFSLDATDITFTGYSDSSSGLIPRLTQSKLLSDPRFQSPVTVDAASRRERFDITAHRATKGAPPS